MGEMGEQVIITMPDGVKKTIYKASGVGKPMG
jgi:hypothetical protein